MSSKTEVQGAAVTQSANLDAIKWVVVIALVLAGLWGYHDYEQIAAAYRALALVPVALIAGFVAITTTQGAAFWSLMREALVEVRRVVWPTRQETTQTTLVVMAVVVVMALVLWGLDAGFGKLLSLVIG